MLMFNPDHYKDQKMCNKAVDNYPWMSVPDCYKTTKMYNKVVSTYPCTIQFVLQCFKNQKISDRAIYTRPFVFYSVFDWYIMLWG